MKLPTSTSRSTSLVIMALLLMPVAVSADNTINDGFIDPFSTVDIDSADPEEGLFLEDPFVQSTDIFADDFSLEDDFDTIFLEDTGITELSDEQQISNEYEQFLKSEELSWGGSFSGSMNASWDWDSYASGLSAANMEDSFSPSVSTSLYFDARPETNFRVFGKLFLETEVNAFALADIDLSNFSFSDNGDGSIEITVPDEDDSEDPDPQPLSLTLGIRELFSDFQYDDRLFFRYGKSFVKWGVGYFFSPADVINLESIDAEDPTAERQGPLNFRLHYPDGADNTYLYLLTDQVNSLDDIALALKTETVIGNSELGFGGYLSGGKAPRVVSTLSTSVRDVRIFGEGVVSFGSDRNFVAESKNQPEFGENDDRYTALDTFTIDRQPFFSGTIGFNYSKSDPNLFIAGQYYFNGEGYPYRRLDSGETLLDAAAYLLLNPQSNGLAQPEEQQPDDYIDPPSLGFSDITNFGMHYGALALSWSAVFDTDLSLSLFWLGNLTDGSGIISPSLSLKIIDRISIGSGIRMTYGRSGTEYADPANLFAQDADSNPQEPTFSITLDVSIGGGAF